MNRMGGWKDYVPYNSAEGQMKSILDPSFRYTNSVETDLRKTFAKIRRALRKQHQAGSGVTE